jgi:hypothetical protein
MNNLPLETLNMLDNDVMIIMRLGLVKGRNLLLKHGYIQCGNPLYYSPDEGKNTMHYNHKLKYWIFESYDWLTK